VRYFIDLSTNLFLKRREVIVKLIFLFVILTAPPFFLVYRWLIRFHFKIYEAIAKETFRFLTIEY
jgi:hypothetical protein